MARVNFKTFKQNSLKDKIVRQEYDALNEEFLFAEELIKARVNANLTQAAIAELMHTSKSNISRLENADAANWPNLIPNPTDLTGAIPSRGTQSARSEEG